MTPRPDENVPAGQELQLKEPAEVWYLPPPHFKQRLEPAVFENVPARHDEHDAALAYEYEPAPQLMQLKLSTFVRAVPPVVLM